MTAIAEELDRRIRSLAPEQAARCEQLVREVLARLDEAVETSDSSISYALPEHSFGLREDIDPTKLGQLAEDL